MCKVGKGKVVVTGHGVVPPIFGSNAAITIAVEACHRRLGEEGERLFEH